MCCPGNAGQGAWNGITPVIGATVAVTTPTGIAAVTGNIQQKDRTRQGSAILKQFADTCPVQALAAP